MRKIKTLPGVAADGLVALRHLDHTGKASIIAKHHYRRCNQIDVGMGLQKFDLSLQARGKRNIVLSMRQKYLPLASATASFSRGGKPFVQAVRQRKNPGVGEAAGDARALVT
jgi:hypothetical protein